MSNEAITLGRMDLKLFVENPAGVDWDGCVTVFTRWLKEDGDEWLDIADYTHVPQGPGVMVVGLEKYVSVDNRRGEPGLLYSRREPFKGSNVERVKALFADAARFAERLSAANVGVDVKTDRLSFAMNDRSVYPNDDLTASAVEAELREALNRLNGVEIERDANPAERLTFTIRVEDDRPLNEWT